MLVSRNFLGQFAPQIKKINEEELIKAFNNCGIEVEKVYKHPQIDGFVVGQILKVEKHPDANKLNVVTVKIGENEIKTIVCGAKNVINAKYVIVAKENTTLHNGLVIQAKELRGVYSCGMICAYSEITPLHQFVNKEDKEGVIALEKGKVGDTNISRILHLDDLIFDLSLPSNRNELNGVYAIIFELAGYFKWKNNFKFFKKASAKLIKAKFTLNNLTDKCKAFNLLLIEQIKIKQSDWNTKALLMNNGIISHNQLVDQLAVVSLITGVPTAVYNIKEEIQKVEVKNNYKSDFIGLDDKKYQINQNDIVVCINDKIAALAGILNAKDFVVNNETSSVLIEIGNFDCLNVRETMNSLKISTDAAKKFSKQISNYLVKMTVDLIFSIFSGQTVKFISSYYDVESDKKIKFSMNDCENFLGVKLNQKNILAQLQSFNLVFKNNNIIVPSYRLDLNDQYDLFEEVLKCIDINKIEEKPINGRLDADVNNKEYLLISYLKDLLNENYFQETKTYNLWPENKLKNFNLFNYQDYLKIANANNENHDYFRTNLIESLLDVYEYNLAYKNDLRPIFEVQRIYLKNESHLNLTLMTTSRLAIDSINQSQINFNLSTLKALLREIAKLFHTSFELINDKNSFLNEKESLVIKYQNEIIGYCGSIKKFKTDKKNIKEKVYLITLNLDSLINDFKKKNTFFKNFYNLQTITKDFSFIANQDVNVQEVIDLLRKQEIIQSVDFVDVYQLDNNLSYAIRVKFNNHKTFNSNETNDLYDQVEAFLEKHGCYKRK